ncbi:MAG: iron ABC transporter permease [Clostridiales bacterium]|nr:iron ABC transporter permease [Clostridiales bacterium]
MGLRKEKNNVSQTRKKDMEDKIQLRMEEEMTTLYKSDAQARYTMSAGGRRIVMLIVALAAILILSLCLLPYGIISGFLEGFQLPQFTYSLAEFRELVVYRTSSLISFVTTGNDPSFGAMICSMLVAILAGYAMSVTGAVYQGLFQNPMASPTTMGVNAGGTLGGIVYILFFYSATAVGATYTSGNTVISSVSGNEIIAWWQSMNIFQRCAQQLCILAGCFIGVALILLISMAAGKGKINTVALLLAGSVFSTLISEVGQLVQYYLSVYGDEDQAAAVSTLIGGSYIGETYSWGELLLMAAPILFCSVVVFAMSGRVNIIVFGEAEARAMGINVTHARNVLIVFCTILSAVVLAFCGTISMVGFMMPHFARYMVGPDFKKLIPASAFLGGIATLLVYDVCYMMAQLSRFNMYIGVVCSIMSAFFIIFYRRNRHADWS